MQIYLKNNARSRIDRIYITETDSGKIHDHETYKINEFDDIHIGPGQWALNVNYLNDPTFRKTLEKEWIEFRKVKNEFRNIKDWRAAVKSYIGAIGISYA